MTREKRVTGVGGIFFKVADPAATRDWYQRHLGMTSDEYGTNFEFRQADNPGEKGFCLWSHFRADSDHFEGQLMPNFRVENLDSLLATLRTEGVEVVQEIETHDYGKFAQVIDGDGMKIELWEPVDTAYDEMIGDARTK